MDFVTVPLADGRKARVLTVQDLFTREGLGIRAHGRFTSGQVVAVLEELPSLVRVVLVFPDVNLAAVLPSGDGVGVQALATCAVGKNVDSREGIDLLKSSVVRPPVQRGRPLLPLASRRGDDHQQDDYDECEL